MISKFEEKKIKYIVNYIKLTTGFSYDEIYQMPLYALEDLYEDIVKENSN